MVVVLKHVKAVAPSVTRGLRGNTSLGLETIARAEASKLREAS